MLCGALKALFLGGTPLPAYCLFCETQKCATIAQIIERTRGIRCIFPQVIQRKWVKGNAQEVRHSLLPGYIFLYPEAPLEKMIWIPGVIRTLGNRELLDEDLAFATMLEEQNGVIGTIRLAQVGNRCTVADPLWEKMEGKVTKIDRGRKRCCIEFSFDGVGRTVWLGYDIIQPIQMEQLIIKEQEAGD